MKSLHTCLAIISFSVLFTFCRKSIENVNPVISDTISSAPVSAPFLENFESGNKTYWQAGSVAFTRGIWRLDNALTGNTNDDKKIDLQSVRIRENGSMRMNFNIISGVYSVIISHASFGNDGASTWQLLSSADDGATYAPVGDIKTSNAIIIQDTFVVNSGAKIRFAIQKLSGGSNRMNIDNFEVTQAPTPQPVNGDDGNMLMGNPSNATPDVVNVNNYFMDKWFYVMSYSRDRGTPNWVSWHVQSSDLGGTARQDDFRADNTLPAGWYQVQNTSYIGSGFDRGHNCPSGDRTASVPINSSTFLMTNMIPQAPNNNQVTWVGLEDYARSLISNGNELFTIMGSYGVGGTGSSGFFNTINNGKVTVPANIWKVVVVLSNGNNDLNRVNLSTRVIAIITPNTNSVGSNWRSYRVSVDSIEAVTGYDLLSNVSTAIQKVIEAKVDTQ